MAGLCLQLLDIPNCDPAMIHLRAAQRQNPEFQVANVSSMGKVTLHADEKAHHSKPWMAVC